MKYLILIRGNPHVLDRCDGLTDAQRDEFGRGHSALVEVRPVLAMSSSDL